MNPEIAPLLIQLGAVVVLLFLNGFFVSVEFAYITIPRPRIDQLIAKGNQNAARVRQLLSNTDRVLATSQIGITMASLGIGWVGENLADEVIRLVTANRRGIIHGIGLALAFVTITFLHIVFGEQAPKIAAVRAADRFALFSARAVALFDTLLHPLIGLLDEVTSAVVKLIGLEPLGAHHTVYPVDELKQLVAETQQHGELEPHEKEMLHNVFEFDDKLVRDVMIPRPDMIVVEENTTIADFLQTFSASSHSRFPIYANSIDHITGFIAIKDVLRAISSQGASALDQTARALARLVIFVPESKRIGAPFAEMQAQKNHIAIVIDEFGGTAGMITLEELIEEIMGSVPDELAHEPPAGFILGTPHRIPKEDAQLQIGNLRLTVTGMSGPKIEKVLVTRL